MPNQTETHRIHRSLSARRSTSMICLFIVGLLLAHADKLDARAETRRTADSESPNAPADLERRVEALEAEVAELKRLLTANSPAASALASNSAAAPPVSSVTPAAATPVSQSSIDASAPVPPDQKGLNFLRDTTINVGLDGYYEYNFNAPVGRVNLLRAYDVLSNNFNLNQASVIFDHEPDVVPDAASARASICNTARPPTRCKAIPPTNPAHRSIRIFFKRTEPTWRR